MGKNKSSQIESPNSLEPEVGEKITHYTHSKHPLTQINLPQLFTCSGCKEYGSGKRFACQKCNFQLHEFCALSPPLLQNHPLHGRHHLAFHAKPKQVKVGISWPKCDVCKKSTKGFTFRCKACSFKMHPCCAMLGTKLNLSVHPHTLKLLPTTSSGAGNRSLCGECNKTRSGQVYRCSVCDYHLHAICAKSSINGLQGIDDIPTSEKPSVMRRTADIARVASRVGFELLGGLLGIKLTSTAGF